MVSSEGPPNLAEVLTKVEETDVIMAEVESVSRQYIPALVECLYFTLEGLNQVRIDASWVFTVHYRALECVFKAISPMVCRSTSCTSNHSVSSWKYSKWE